MDKQTQKILKGMADFKKMLQESPQTFTIPPVKMPKTLLGSYSASVVNRGSMSGK